MKDWKQPATRWPMASCGFVVFGAMFLPNGDGCSAAPMVPVEHAPAYPPHLLGLMVVAMLLAPRAAEGLVYAIRLLIWLVAAVVIVMMLPLQQVSMYQRVAPIFLGTGIIAATGIGSFSELTLSRTVIGVALTAAAWFLWQTGNPGDSAAYGAILGAAGALGLFACGVMWLREALKARAAELAKR